MFLIIFKSYFSRLVKKFGAIIKCVYAERITKETIGNVDFKLGFKDKECFYYKFLIFSFAYWNIQAGHPYHNYASGNIY